MYDTKYHIVVVLVECLLPEAQSLKDKRMVLRSLKDRARQKFNVAVAELDGHEKWQRMTVGFVLLGNEHKHLDRSAQYVLNFVETFDRIQICDHRIEFI